MTTNKKVTLVLMCVVLAFSVGCGKKDPLPPPPPPPPPEPAAPPKPTVSLSGEPSSIERGKAATLKWSSSNAASASRDQGIGTIPTTGSREVFPTRTTNYRITVKGEGGEASASATVTVRTPPPPPPPPAPEATFSERINQSVKDAYFDYDKSDIRADAASTLRSNATALKGIFSDFPSGKVLVEGHCDERGTNEYNLALGDSRASAARDYLVNLGVASSKLSTVSYGEERPQCSSEDESCWQRNRRAHFTPVQ